MKKLVTDIKVKELLDDNIENLLLTKQTVNEIKEDCSVIETTILPETTYNFANGSRGFKTLKIISDVPITMSYTSTSNTYNFGAKFKEIQLVSNGEDESEAADWVARYGSVTLTNISTEDVAHITIIFTY